MASLAERFESKVDRSGDHHHWTGSKKPDGTGKMEVEGKQVTARRVAWQLGHGTPPASDVKSLCGVKSCVRLDHLHVDGPPSPASSDGGRRGPRGSGTKRDIRPGVWKLTVSAGTYPDGSARRINRTVTADNGTQAAQLLAALVAEASAAPRGGSRETRDVLFDEAVERFLQEHLREEKGREEKTVSDYRKLHAKWFRPDLGSRRVRDIRQQDVDSIFGRMRRAGLSRSRMNQAKSLYAPFFRWAKNRQMTMHNPMADFELPTSRYVAHEKQPPEVEELCVLLQEAVEVVPDVAPVLVLCSVTGLRRGELVGLRRSGIEWDKCRINIDEAISETNQVKRTKTGRGRGLYVDAETVAMLQRHCAEMDARAALFGTTVTAAGYVFSLEPDCSRAMPPDYLTDRVAKLKEHLGIADKRPETIKLEDEALRLYRQAPAGRQARTGPASKGAMSFRRIGEQLGRSQRWAVNAVASAERREAALERGLSFEFDGSTKALRKFTSSELLDAGFNISMVAQRQGHGPQVLIKHYAKSRKSADRRAADHLGKVVHGSRSPQA